MKRIQQNKVVFEFTDKKTNREFRIVWLDRGRQKINGLEWPRVYDVYIKFPACEAVHVSTTAQQPNLTNNQAYIKEYLISTNVI